jgi:hypothetical protein
MLGSLDLQGKQNHLSPRLSPTFSQLVSFHLKPASPQNHTRRSKANATLIGKLTQNPVVV